VLAQNDAGVNLLPYGFSFDEVWNSVDPSKERENNGALFKGWRELSLVLPYPDMKCWGYAFTYADHCKEMQLNHQGRFKKNASIDCMSCDDIIYRPHLDYEAEIGILMHRDFPARFGYCMLNDLTDRGRQLMQYNPSNPVPGFSDSKSFEGALRIGPLLMIGDESAWDDLEILLRLNGETRQIIRSRECNYRPCQFHADIFGHDEKSSEWILVATGTGKGVLFKPPRPLTKMRLFIRSGFSAQGARERWLTELNFLNEGDILGCYSAALGMSLATVRRMNKFQVVSRVEYIISKKEFPIPVRIFEGKKDHLPLILLHGLQSHSAWFVQSARFIADCGIPVYAMDRRGSGLSRAPRGECHDFHEMVRDIDTVASHIMKKHDAESVHILGHCFGAIPAVLYSLIYPHKVKSLMLSTPGIYTHSDLSIFHKLIVFVSHFIHLPLYLPVPLETELFSDLEPYRRFISEDELSLRNATISFYYQIHRARLFIKTHADRLTMPVFMAVAKHDEIVDNQRNKKFFDSLPGATKVFKEYESARHILEFSTDRDKFFAGLKDWFCLLGEL